MPTPTKPTISHAKGPATATAQDDPDQPFVRNESNTTTLPKDTVPRPNGNYSHVIHTNAGSSGGTLQLCGWMGDEPATGRIVHRTAQGQMNQIMRNISAVLASQGADLSKITRRRVYLVDMVDLRAVDRVWGEWVGAPYPVSTCVGVTALAKEGAVVEVEVEAVL